VGEWGSGAALNGVGLRARAPVAERMGRGCGCRWVGGARSGVWSRVRGVERVRKGHESGGECVPTVRPGE
jgi:hypothetical protein